MAIIIIQELRALHRGVKRDYALMLTTKSYDCGKSFGNNIFVYVKKPLITQTVMSYNNSYLVA